MKETDLAFLGIREDLELSIRAQLPMSYDNEKKKNFRGNRYEMEMVEKN